MNRRYLLAALASVAGIQAAGAHTPYGQWAAYRQKHLLIGAHRADGKTYDLAKQIAGHLAEHLPRSRARVARAPTAGRLASLLSTEQLDVVVLSHKDARAMLEGTGRFEAYGPVPVRLLATLDQRLLLAHERFPRRHAWLVMSALHDSPLVTGSSTAIGQGVEPHPGSLAFLNGEADPDHE